MQRLSLVPPPAARLAGVAFLPSKEQRSNKSRRQIPLPVDCGFSDLGHKGCRQYMAEPRNGHFKLLLTRKNYLAPALTPILSLYIPSCPILRVGFGQLCQLFDTWGPWEADERARSRRGTRWRSSSARTRTRWTRRGGYPSRLRSARRLPASPIRGSWPSRRTAPMRWRAAASTFWNC